MQHPASRAAGALLPFERVVALDGSAGAPWQRRLAAGASLRDLADAVHALCTIHAAHPGVIDYATRHDDIGAARWLADAAAGFAVERGDLAHLAAAVGPLPSTPAQAQALTALAGQRRALELLASSDRSGCALGAAAALVLDWRAVRAVLDAAAGHLGHPPASSPLPGRSATLAMLDRVAVTPAVTRALRFGAEQLLAQHRGLWDLLEARAEARG